ncbi:UDP-N-acetylmuramoyl-L-alanyl-D-glutamate--2,6-diaminopimelate ligase [Sporosarcina sp. YIM B06819]|uniref:UDP-N-acetylmuramoyl-L-alanyl-D-glutamate--2, 6-diaminopimelate ligase n=1 Tax=Sporosarcina sp. YIM B06819 TaxID=3081769 RepID=UPI00298D0F3F|nr:UDP-N-acetylmuramoyl-L-alanyl-D-glutamate--2,6-diaminopimelate ligase [Sporosarcina sp. YIM B06819]
MLLLTELLKDWPCTVSGGGIRTSVTGITENSSRVQKGFVFVARKGGRNDGTIYIQQAIDQGAVAIVVDRTDLISLPDDITVVIVPDCKLFIAHACARFAGYPARRMKVIAVTGTNGKTTVTHFIGQLLQSLGNRPVVIGTTGIFIDGVKIDYDSPQMTTLPAEYLHPLLQKCEGMGVTHVVLEASSLGLASRRLDYCEIDIGILLNIGTDHYEEHGGKLAYILAKKRLSQMVTMMVVNGEDEQCVQMVQDTTTPVVYFGMNPLAGVPVSDLEKNFVIPGHYNRMNALAAMSALVVLGYSLDDVMQYCGQLQLPEGRLQQLERDGVKVYIDYAHTPDALQAVLCTLSTCCYGKLITVFGCGGNRDKGKRAEMGELAVLYSSNVIVTSDNPRNEDPLAIIGDILEGFGGDCSAVEVILDRKNAIRKAVFSAAPGDSVLIAGKGHEKTQQTADGILPFSDFEVAKRALFEKTFLDFK